MNTLEIIEKYLKENGYDGLYSQEGECGCEMHNLAPCCCSIWEIGDCQAAYKIPCPDDCTWGGDCGFHMTAKKPEERDTDDG